MLVLATDVSLATSVGTGVDGAGLADRPRDEPVDVLAAEGVRVLSKLASSFDGVDARESLSLPLVLAPSGFFGFGAATAVNKSEHE